MPGRGFCAMRFGVRVPYLPAPRLLGARGAQDVAHRVVPLLAGGSNSGCSGSAVNVMPNVHGFVHVSASFSVTDHSIWFGVTGRYRSTIVSFGDPFW